MHCSLLRGLVSMLTACVSLLLLCSILFFPTIINLIAVKPHAFNGSFIDAYAFSDMVLLWIVVGIAVGDMLVSYWPFDGRVKRHGERVIYWPVRETDLVALNAAPPEMIAS